MCEDAAAGGGGFRQKDDGLLHLRRRGVRQNPMENNLVYF